MLIAKACSSNKSHVKIRGNPRKSTNRFEIQYVKLTDHSVLYYIKIPLKVMKKCWNLYWCILVPRGRAPFGQHQESHPLARSNDIPVLNGFVNTIDWDQSQSDLSDLTLSMHRVVGSPWIAVCRCWTWPEVATLGADQKERGLWGRECYWCCVHTTI